jgi:GT2 family glycosyltransferase
VPQAPRATIIVPVYNQVFHTRICLAALEQAGWTEVEVIVVDNGSVDETPEVLSRWADGGPGRTMLAPGFNMGFARGCNYGAAHARGGHLIFLNNDTFVLPDWLPELLRPLEEARAEVAGSLLLYPNGRVQHAGIAFDEHGPHHVFAGLLPDVPPVRTEREWQAVTGASLAIDRQRFLKLNGFDEEFVNSFEDVDLCLRIKENGGRILYVPTSVAYHFEGMTEGRQGPQDRRNYDRFIERWRGRFAPDLRPALAEAAAIGVDLDDRVPPKTELLQAKQARMLRAEAELADYRLSLGDRMLAKLKTRLRAVPSRIRRRVRAPLRKARADRL